MRTFYLFSFQILFSGFFLTIQADQYSGTDPLIRWLDSHIDHPEDTVKVLRTLNQALYASDFQLSYDQKAQLFLYYGKYHEYYGHLDSSVFYFEEAIEFFRKGNDQQSLAEAYLHCSDILSLQSKYTRSMEQVYTALDIFEKIKNDAGVARCYTYICDLLYYENEYDESREYCNKAIKIQEKLGKQEDLALSYYYRSCSELFSDLPLDSSLLSITKSLNIYHTLGENGIPLLKSLNWRGNVYKYMKRYGDALSDYKTTMESARRIGNNHYTITALANLGHLKILMGKFNEALPYNLEAIDLMEKTGDTRNLWENYMHVADSYEQIGNLKQALVYQKKYSKAYDGYLESIIERLETEAQVKYETAKKEETIQNQDQKIATQRKFQWLYLSIAALLAVLLAGMYFALNNIRKKRAILASLNMELDARNRQNELLLREIHHRVKNNLEMVKSLISLQSAQLEDKNSREVMIASQNRVQSMGIIHQKLYQGDQLGSIEMKDYFINLSEGILDSFGAENRVQIACTMGEIYLDVDTAVPIGLIVNELLTNSLKYAFPDGAPGHIDIQLNRPDNHTLSLRVSDNGIGHQKERKPQGTGFGKQLIKLLTKQLNGVINIDSSSGTVVNFEFNILKL